MQTRAEAGWPIWPMLLLISGVAIAVAGVALRANGMALGTGLIAGGVPLAAMGGIFGLWRRERGEPAVAVVEASAGPALAAAAAQLGLRQEEGRAVGELKHRAVEIATVGESALLVRAAVVRKLDMGLSVKMGQGPGDARKLIAIGDPAFDALYAVRVDEPERALRILSPRLTAQLLETHAELDDHGASILVAPDVDTVVGAVRAATKVAAELDRASGHVHCAEPLAEVRGAWLAYAEEKSLATADTPLSMWGTIDGITISAVAVRDAFEHFHFEIATDFATPLGRGLVLKPASSATQFDRSGEPVGHPAFDKIFVLKSADPLDAPRLLGPDTREAILQLRDSGVQLRARDAGLWAWVGLNRAELDLVPRGITRMVQIAHRILANAERFPPGGPR